MAHPPIQLTAPNMDCEPFARVIVQHIRALLSPEAYNRIDVYGIVNLCTGMTALLSDPERAISQVLHRVGLLAETMGWTRSGWIETLRHVTLTSDRHNVRTDRTTPTAQDSLPRSRLEAEVLPLQVRRSMHEIGLPTFAISEALRTRLAWLAEETHRSLEETLTTLVDVYVRWRQGQGTFDMFRHVFLLADHLQIAEIDVASLRHHLACEAALHRHGLGIEDVPEALRLIHLLSKLPTPWDWRRARQAVSAVAYLIREEIPAEQIAEVIVHHRRLKQLGFDERVAVAVANVLARENMVGTRRDAVLRNLVENVGVQIEVEQLRQEKAQLLSDSAIAQRRLGSLERSVRESKARLEQLTQQETQSRQRLEELQSEADALAYDLEVLRGFRASLLGKHGTIEAFFADLERVRAYRDGNIRPSEQYAVLMLDTIRPAVLAFIQRMLQEGGES